jgi:glycerophosphoryl diester phosphodiesterase
MRVAIFLLWLAMAACSSSKSPAMKKDVIGSFDLQGHRGCRGLMPENSIPAMLKALELGVTTLEMDVSITKDSVCVLSHEPFFNHEISTKPDGSLVTKAEEKSLNIFTMHFEMVKTFDVGLRPHPRFPEQQKVAAYKPALSSVFDAVKSYCSSHNQPLPYFNIETKTAAVTDHIFHPAPEAFVDLLIQVVVKADMQSKVIIQSFDFRTLQVLHEKYPTIKTAALIEEDDALPFAQQLKKLGFIPTIYSPAHQLVTPLLVKQCHDMGIKLIPWTVNDAAIATQLKAMGIDGIITDYPDRIR